MSKRAPKNTDKLRPAKAGKKARAGEGGMIPKHHLSRCPPFPNSPLSVFLAMSPVNTINNSFQFVEMVRDLQGEVLQKVEPLCLAFVGTTCKTMHKIVKQNY